MSEYANEYTDMRRSNALYSASDPGSAMRQGALVVRGFTFSARRAQRSGQRLRN
jgi:hypothetical protein